MCVTRMSSSNESIVKLIELVGLCKRALEACQQECSKANEVTVETKTLADSIHLLNPKLRFISAEVAKQIEASLPLCSHWP